MFQKAKRVSAENSINGFLAAHTETTINRGFDVTRSKASALRKSERKRKRLDHLFEVLITPATFLVGIQVFLVKGDVSTLIVTEAFSVAFSVIAFAFAYGTTSLFRRGLALYFLLTAILTIFAELLMILFNVGTGTERVIVAIVVAYVFPAVLVWHLCNRQFTDYYD